MRHVSFSPVHQRGAIGLMAALTLLIGLMFLMLAVDSGRLYVEKRRLQRVADMAALEAVSRRGDCASGSAQTFAEENATQRNGFALDTQRSLLTACGSVSSSAGVRSFSEDGSGQVIRAIATSTVPASLILGGLFGQQVTLQAQAVAGAQVPLAALTLRTTLVSVDSSQSVLLNAVFGGLLGGSVNVSAVGWNGLVKTDINLLDFLDLLAVDQGLTVGDYQQVLTSNVALGDLLDVAADALAKGGSSADIAAGVAGLQALSAVVPAGTPLLKLSDILAVQSAVPKAGLDLALNAFQLAQAMVQLANSENAAVASVPVTIPGVATVNVQIKVIEPPQLSAIGNPELAKQNPFGDEQIYVRSAQVRSLISVDLGGGAGTPAANLLTQTTNTLTPVLGLLNGVLGLDLVNAVGNFLGGLICPVLGPCPSTSAVGVRVLADNRLDINLDAGAGDARVTDYSCSGSADKSLTVTAKTAAAQLRVGKLGSSAADAAGKVFASNNTPVVQAMPLLALGKQTARPDACLLALCTGVKWKKGSTWITEPELADFDTYAGFGAKISSDVAGSNHVLTYSAPDAQALPDIGEAPAFQTVSSQSLVNSLSGTLAGVDIESYQSSSPGLLGSLISTAVTGLNGLLSSLEGIVDTVLSPLLDPLLNTLLDTLGLDLAQADVGANLTCATHARLLL